MKKLNKYYKLAMDYYCEGNLQKSMNYCNKVLEINREHSPTLNLKGLIYYIKGDLENAQLNWKINYKINGDEVSKNYLDDSKNDKNKIYIYSQGVLFFNEVQVKKALECFLKCENSHFNAINLWNYIALCYMKIGDYENCLKYMQEVLKLDRDNNIALEIKTQLEEIKIIHKTMPWKSIRNVAVIILLVLITSMGIFQTINNWENITLFFKGALVKDTIEDTNKNVNKLDVEKNGKENTSNNKIEDEHKNTGKEKDELKFDKEILNSMIKSEKYDDIYNYIYNFKEVDLKVNDKVAYENARSFLKDKGVTHFYEEGSTLIKNNNYEKALIYLQKAYEYSEESYLREHVIYLMAFCNEKTGDIEQSNKYYEEYVKKYNDEGSYIEQCLYSLAINNEKIDIDKSRKYAKILSDNFKKSDFNNTRIKTILDK